MHKVTEQIRAALLARRSMTIGNTRTDGESVWLHGNKIVERRGDNLYWTLAGWPTSTTRERVNGIANAGVFQKDHCQFIAGRTPQNNDYDVPVDPHEWILGQA